MKNYSLFPELILRTPFLPIDLLFQPLQTEEDLEELIRAQYTRPEIREALYIGSPNLHAEYLKLESGQITAKKEIAKLHYALFRYLIRMSTRCTPFGFFAGTHVGQWSKTTDTVLSSPLQHQRHTRLDMLYLCNLAQKMAKNPAIRPYLKFYPNNTIYTLGDQLRYIEYHYFRGSRRYEISSVEHSAYLDKVLKSAEPGKYLQELIDLLLDDEITQEDAQEFLDEVANSQLLISELEPAITGNEFLDQLLVILARLQIEIPASEVQAVSEIHRCLSEVQQQLRALDKSFINTTPASYEGIAQQLEPLDIPINMRFLFQVDLVKTMASCQLNNRIAGSIRKGIEVLNRLNPPLPQSRLNRFKEVFMERYESAAVPLLQALDNETGIGYLQYGDTVGDITPLIDDVPIPNSTTSFEVKWSSIQQFLLDKYSTALATNEDEVTLTDDELKVFPPQWDDLPETLNTMAVVLQDQQDQQQRLIHLKFAGGSSATNLVGRFTHADPRIYDYARKLAKEESNLNPNVIYAEIIHLPQNRTGNILLRRQLRAFEIPFLSPASVPKENQIHLSDLTVSIRGGRIVLWSKKHNREVIPRLGTAHNFSSNALPIYHFLCDLQSQNKRLRLGFYWGAIFQKAHFLPRVKYRDVILHRKTWHFDQNQLSFFLKPQHQDWEQQIQLWREKWRIPRYVLLIDHDNELFIDLESRPYLHMFAGQIKKATTITLKESLFHRPNTIVKDEQGQHYTNEVIMAFIKQQTPVVKPAVKTLFLPDVQRRFALGSEWLYYKIYLGPKMGDQVLMHHLGPLAQHLINKGWIDSWFFIRYQDPRFHIRVRFHLTDLRFLAPIISYLSQQLTPLLEEQLIWTLQTDTYQREIERYGSNTIALAEKIFFLDSQCIVKALQIVG